MDNIYYVEIPNNKRFKGVYVNKKVILEDESIIDTEFKIHLLKREFEIFRLKNKLRDLKRDFEQLKRDLLGAEDDIEEDIDEDDLFK